MKPYRPEKQTDNRIHVYVGGVSANMSTFPSLHGCIRGLKIGDKVMELQKAALFAEGTAYM